MRHWAAMEKKRKGSMQHITYGGPKDGQMNGDSEFPT